MKKTILDMWRGEMCPISRSGLNNSELRRLETHLQRSREESMECLSEKQKPMFEYYVSLHRDYSNELSDQAFVDGYSLGTRITAEALLEAEEID